MYVLLRFLQWKGHFHILTQHSPLFPFPIWELLEIMKLPFRKKVVFS